MNSAYIKLKRSGNAWPAIRSAQTIIVNTRVDVVIAEWTATWLCILLAEHVKALSTQQMSWETRYGLKQSPICTDLRDSLHDAQQDTEQHSLQRVQVGKPRSGTLRDA